MINFSVYHYVSIIKVIHCTVAQFELLWPSEILVKDSNTECDHIWSLKAEACLLFIGSNATTAREVVSMTFFTETMEFSNVVFERLQI